MIRSIFIINKDREVLLEKHWKTITPRSALESVCEAIHFFQLLDEMLDNGFPLTTEPNILRELIKPPKLLRSIAEVVTGRPVGGVTSTLPVSQLTNLRWRRAGVKYTTNEAFFDFTESVNAIIDRSGNILLAEVEGAIDCTMHLSGTPDLTLIFNNPRLLDDVGLHPCVRYFRWDKQRILSFIPPDGKFRLFTYFIPNLSSISLPIALRHNISLKAVSNRFELSVSPKSTAGRPLEKVKVSVAMPSEVSSVNVTPSLGKSSFDTVTKMLTWEVGHLETQTYPSLKGSVTLHSGFTQVSTAPIVNLHFEFPQSLVSGLRVSKLDMHVEVREFFSTFSNLSPLGCDFYYPLDKNQGKDVNYKPYKGVKYVTVAGNFEVRV
ncbi:unnamed protein product [Taenia asiatica]|uniref:MHD domain-containing protein n=1 Tax=Taenia asiatica TaxID=60517 RepID=A0A0R3W5R1_TAEAS|nr:unnamed protein product [Taenia asiatica]